MRNIPIAQNEYYHIFNRGNDKQKIFLDKRDKIRFLLKEVADLERLVGRLNLGTANPRDLLALNTSLSKTPKINFLLSDAKSLLVQVLSENVFELPHIQELISNSIADEPPINITDGGVIRDGYSDELDQIRRVSSSAKQTIARRISLQACNADAAPFAYSSNDRSAVSPAIWHRS